MLTNRESSDTTPNVAEELTCNLSALSDQCSLNLEQIDHNHCETLLEFDHDTTTGVQKANAALKQSLIKQRGEGNDTAAQFVFSGCLFDVFYRDFWILNTSETITERLMNAFMGLLDQSYGDGQTVVFCETYFADFLYPYMTGKAIVDSFTWFDHVCDPDGFSPFIRPSQQKNDFDPFQAHRIFMPLSNQDGHRWLLVVDPRHKKLYHLDAR
jgi:hypothetical protein